MLLRKKLCYTFILSAVALIVLLSPLNVSAERDEEIILLEDQVNSLSNDSEIDEKIILLEDQVNSLSNDLEIDEVLNLVKDGKTLEGRIFNLLLSLKFPEYSDEIDKLGNKDIGTFEDLRKDLIKYSSIEKVKLILGIEENEENNILRRLKYIRALPLGFKGDKNVSIYLYYIIEEIFMERYIYL